MVNSAFVLVLLVGVGIHQSTEQRRPSRLVHLWLIRTSGSGLTIISARAQRSPHQMHHLRELCPILRVALLPEASTLLISAATSSDGVLVLLDKRPQGWDVRHDMVASFVSEASFLDLQELRILPEASFYRLLEARAVQRRHTSFEETLQQKRDHGQRMRIDLPSVRQPLGPHARLQSLQNSKKTTQYYYTEVSMLGLVRCFLHTTGGELQR